MENINQDSFKNFVGLSIVGHILLVTVFSVKFALFPSQDIVIQSAIRVDMVALPDKKQEPAKINVAQKASEPVKLPDKDAPKEKKPPIDKVKEAKSKQNKALDKLKAMAALDKLKEQVEKKDTPPPTKEPEPYKGNIVTTGSDLGGLSKLQYDEYFAKLEKHVKENWVLPQWLIDAEYKAQVKVTIDNRGYITSKTIITSSGNNVFDSMALEALEKSSPCPTAPSSLQTLIGNEGIIFNFP